MVTQIHGSLHFGASVTKAGAVAEACGPNTMPMNIVAMPPTVETSPIIGSLRSHAVQTATTITGQRLSWRVCPPRKCRDCRSITILWLVHGQRKVRQQNLRM